MEYHANWILNFNIKQYQRVKPILFRPIGIHSINYQRNLTQY